MKIGYVGLGSMGGALARRLQLTHALNVYDVDPAAVRRMVEKGAKASASLRELAAASDVILLCLPTSTHVRAAIFGPGGDHWWGGRPGVFSRLNPGTGQFPLVSSTRRGEFRVQIPDDGEWKVLHRGQRPLDVAKRGG